MASAALSKLDNNYRAVAVQGVAHKPLSNFAESLHRFQPSGSSSSVALKHGGKGEPMSLTNSGRTFRERFSDALRRRLSPKTNLTVPQLAGAIGVSDTTIKNLLSRANEPSARVIDECVAMFKDSFLNEIYGCHNIHCIDTRATQKAAAMRKLAEAHDELRRLG
jgi:predicted NBD/HSP70 family sugar kinase